MMVESEIGRLASCMGLYISVHTIFRYIQFFWTRKMKYFPVSLTYKMSHCRIGHFLIVNNNFCSINVGRHPVEKHKWNPIIL